MPSPVQWVKDLVLPPLWLGYKSLAQELPYATDVAIKQTNKHTKEWAIITSVLTLTVTPFTLFSNKEPPFIITINNCLF